MTTSPAQSSQIPSLDGFRALAILIVFAGHVRLHPAIPGGFGVTVFFFLSGFLITSLLLREYDRHGTIAFGAFFARRVAVLKAAVAFHGVARSLKPGCAWLTSHAVPAVRKAAS